MSTAHVPKLTIPAPIVTTSMEDLRDDVIAALIEQGYKPQAARTTVALCSATEFSAMFREALERIRKINGVMQKPTAPAKPAAAKDAPGAPVMCSQHCGRRLRSDNKKGICTECRHKAKQPASAVNQPPAGSLLTPPVPTPAPEKKFCPGFPKACGKELSEKNTSGFCPRCYARHLYHSARTSRVPSAMRSEMAAAGRFAVLLSEPQMDRFLDGLECDWKAFVRMLPADLKLALVNHYFVNDLDQPVTEAEKSA